jgi:hypothetical protein
VSLIRKFDQKLDEQRMLTNMISHFFIADEITNWVEEHEHDISVYFSVPQDVFGKSLSLDTNPERVASSIAKRIYHIRNTLVHNKEGDLPRFIPFSGQDETLHKELPLILFLAEQLIVKTGTDL